jgi:V/A-type H+-transporting ATPase subunit B
MTPRLHTLEYQTVTEVTGPLLIVDKVRGVAYGELVEVIAPDGEVRLGQVLELEGARAVIEVFAGTRGLDVPTTTVRARGEMVELAVGTDLLGRWFDGSGRPIDGGPPPLGETTRPAAGLPMNPALRDHPSELIQTGISAIDGLNSLVRGQKLPIFSGFGLPAERLVAEIAGHAKVPGAGDEPFVVVFAALGVTAREAHFYREFLEASGTLSRTVVFMNHADDPAIERLLTPRLALTAAEFFAFERGMHVLAILADMTHYCEALREVATAREEVPGRRGFPGYMYTDLATIYERAGRVRGGSGSLTQLVVLSMPDDDITHPIADLTGYITEGQIVLSRDLHRQGIWPPIDVLPSLSRLMNAGIGPGKTREDHRAVADQLYATYARGRDLRRLVAIVGEAGIASEDRSYLAFADDFERRYLHQGGAERDLTQTLDLAWELLSPFSDAQLKRIPAELIARYRKGVQSSSEAAARSTST